MKLSEAIREWKSNITTHMAVEHVLALRADINAFSDAAQVLEVENERLRKENTSLRKSREREFAASCETATNHMLEVGKLRDENAKLEKRLAQYELFREVVGDPAHEFASLRRGLHNVERENAKLRGMVAVLWECCACNTDSFWCEGCDYHDVGGCKVREQINRLGIEVE